MVQCIQEIDSGQVIISILLFMGTIIACLPQQWKIIEQGNSNSLSPWFLMLGGIICIANWLNVFILQAPFLKCFFRVSIKQFLYNIIGTLQMTNQLLTFFTIYFLYYKYFPEENKISLEVSGGGGGGGGGENRINSLYTRQWRDALLGMKVTIYFCFGGIFILSFGVLTSKRIVIDWLTWCLATCSLLSSMLQFVPQIMMTIKTKTVGALSLRSMALQAPGCFILSWVLAHSSGTNFSSYISYLVSGILQGSLFFICIYYKNIDHSHSHHYIRITTSNNVEGGGSGDEFIEEDEAEIDGHI